MRAPALAARLAVLAVLAAALAAPLVAACGPGRAAAPRTASPAASAAPPAAAPARPAPPAPGFRLPAGARPLAYRVTLDVDPARPDFTGEAEIDLERAADAGDVLYLNAHQLTVTSASLAVTGAAAPLPLEISVPEAHSVAFRAPPGATLPTGRATLRLAWRGLVEVQDSTGLFTRSSDGKPYLFTQLEPIAARRVLPCFDEPAFKTPWQLTLIVPRGQVALGNSPVAAQRDEGPERTRVDFAPTPPLPSYLIAFTVGPWELVDAGKSRDGVPIRVAVPPGRAAEATIPVEDTAPLLTALEDYFGSPYPYAKLDLVPIPDTVGFAAMENPGLITYSIELLLQKPEHRTFWDRRGHAYTAAHELAHQWFGNLVTMAWWNDIWLNEAFASWLGDRVVHAWKPEWKTDLYNVGAKGRIMVSDSRESTRKIREPVADENALEEAFDGITYGKGQLLLAMVERWIGAEAFQKGMRLYMQRHALGSATYDDLLAALGEASGQPVKAVFDDFVDQTGVPFLRFTLVCDKGRAPRLEARQSRFVPFGSKLDTARTWHVPVTVRWKAGKTVGRSQGLLNGAEGAIELAGAPSCPTWVMPNEDGVGYYRWSLAGAPFDALRSPKVFKALPAAERVEIASTVYGLITAGELPYRRGVELAMTLIDDPEREVREYALQAGRGFDEWLPAALVPKYRAWVKRTYGPLAKKVGWVAGKDETDDEKALRPQILWRMALDAEDAATHAQATQLAYAWLADRKAVAPEMVGTVLGIAAYAGDEALYERFLAEARAAHARHDKAERERFLGVLAGFRDPKLAARTRAMMLEDEFPAAETRWFLTAGSGSKEGREAVWAFLVANYQAIHERLPREERAALVFVGADCSRAGLERNVAFFADKTPKELMGPRTYQRFVEGQELCIARREKDVASFVEFLTGKK